MRRVTSFCVLLSSSLLLLLRGACSEHAFCRNAREIPQEVEKDGTKAEKILEQVPSIKNESLPERLECIVLNTKSCNIQKTILPTVDVISTHTEKSQNQLDQGHVAELRKLDENTLLKRSTPDRPYRMIRMARSRYSNTRRRVVRLRRNGNTRRRLGQRRNIDLHRDSRRISTRRTARSRHARGNLRVRAVRRQHQRRNSTDIRRRQVRLTRRFTASTRRRVNAREHRQQSPLRRRSVSHRRTNSAHLTTTVTTTNRRLHRSRTFRISSSSTSRLPRSTTTRRTRRLSLRRLTRRTLTRERRLLSRQARRVIRQSTRVRLTKQDTIRGRRLRRFRRGRIYRYQRETPGNVRSRRSATRSLMRTRRTSGTYRLQRTRGLERRQQNKRSNRLSRRNRRIRQSSRTTIQQITENGMTMGLSQLSYSRHKNSRRRNHRQRRSNKIRLQRRTRRSVVSFGRNELNQKALALQDSDRGRELPDTTSPKPILEFAFVTVTKAVESVEAKAVAMNEDTRKEEIANRYNNNFHAKEIVEKTEMGDRFRFTLDSHWARGLVTGLGLYLSTRVKNIG